MNETTKTLLGDIAIAGGVAICVGALVACASWPLVAWLNDRRSGRGGQSEDARVAVAPVAPFPAFSRSDRRVAGPSLAAIPVVDGQGLTTPLAVLSLDGDDLADDPQVTPVPNAAAARVVAELEGRR